MAMLQVLNYKNAFVFFYMTNNYDKKIVRIHFALNVAQAMQASACDVIPQKSKLLMTLMQNNVFVILDFIVKTMNVNHAICCAKNVLVLQIMIVFLINALINHILLKILEQLAYICAEHQRIIYLLTCNNKSVKVFFYLYLSKKDCVAPCRSCFADDSNSCLSCINSWVLYGTECIKECPAKFYTDSGVCLPCDPHCKACSSKQNFCINGCEEPYLFKDNKCIPDCGDGYANNNGTCEPCDKGCASCKYESKMKKCLRCDQNKFMFNNICIDDCPQGQFGNTEKGLCEYCSSECKECFGKTFHECYSCNTIGGYMMVSENTCMFPTCTSGSYYNATARECQNCPKECSECESYTNCTNCQKGYIFDYSHTKCFDPCSKIGFTHKEGQCTEICGDARNMGILECDDGNLIDGDGCSKDCKIEEYYECSGGDYEHADICINRKPLELKSFNFYGNRTVVLIFASKAMLLKSFNNNNNNNKVKEIKFKDIIKFSIETENGEKGVDWSYSEFNIDNFKKITFQVNLNFSLSGNEVFFLFI